MNRWQADTGERAARAKALSERVAALRGTAQSTDGLVDVAVDSGGAIVDLHLDERIRNQPAPDTALSILTAMRVAQASLAPQVRRAAFEELGPDDPTGDAIVASYARRFSALDEDAIN